MLHCLFEVAATEPVARCLYLYARVGGHQVHRGLHQRVRALLLPLLLDDSRQGGERSRIRWVLRVGAGQERFGSVRVGFCHLDCALIQGLGLTGVPGQGAADGIAFPFFDPLRVVRGHAGGADAPHEQGGRGEEQESAQNYQLLVLRLPGNAVNHPGDLVVAHPGNELELDGSAGILPSGEDPRFAAKADRAGSDEPLVIGRSPSQIGNREAALAAAREGIRIGPADRRAPDAIVDDCVRREQADEAGEVAAGVSALEAADECGGAGRLLILIPPMLNRLARGFRRALTFLRSRLLSRRVRSGRRPVDGAGLRRRA